MTTDEMISVLEERMDPQEFAELIDAATESDTFDEDIEMAYQNLVKVDALPDFEVCEHRMTFEGDKGPVERIVGYYLKLERNGSTCYSGSTFQFVAKPQFVSGLFRKSELAEEAAVNFLKFEAQQRATRASANRVIFVSAQLPFVEVVSPNSTAQLKRQLSIEQLRTLHSIREGYLQQDIRLDDKPITTLGDTVAKLLDDIAAAR